MTLAYAVKYQRYTVTSRHARTHPVETVGVGLALDAVFAPQLARRAHAHPARALRRRLQQRRHRVVEGRHLDRQPRADEDDVCGKRPTNFATF